jgi:hypothetical protein
MAMKHGTRKIFFSYLDLERTTICDLGSLFFFGMRIKLEHRTHARKCADLVPFLTESDLVPDVTLLPLTCWRTVLVSNIPN